MIILGLGLIFGMGVLRGRPDSGIVIRFGVGSLIFLLGGTGMLLRFFQIARHRLPVDRSGIRSGGWFLKASIPWDKITLAQENARGMRRTGRPGTRTLRIEHDIDHYSVLAALTRLHLQAARKVES